jgi:L-seryl-tRNA(Ser) seleniumtransferase
LHQRHLPRHRHHLREFVSEEINPLRSLPQVQRLLEMPAAQSLCSQYGHTALADALRDTLAVFRQQIGAGTLHTAPDAGELIALAGHTLVASRRLGLRRVINATGIVLHTNLGRAPLAADAVAAVADIAAGYCNLEFDLTTGRRGSRGGMVEELLRTLTGAEAALVVNNGAAAILLAMSALGGGGEVIVSRGELVEIGGGFRIPDIIRQGGAHLVEVGSTNRTRLRDYQAAIGTETRVLLKVHQSNFRTIGFTAQTGITELSALAASRGLAVVADLGSGLLQPVPGKTEPTLQQALQAGADLVTCSGDKLLGGPQAGLILGRRAAVQRLREQPLLRALRLDKMSLAALEVTLMLHRDHPQRVPVHFMLTQTEPQLRQRVLRLQQLTGAGHLMSTHAFAGGGALPEERLGSYALTLQPAHGAEEAAARLREGSPAVVARVQEDQLVVDLFTVRDEDVPRLAEALRQVLA